MSFRFSPGGHGQADPWFRLGRVDVSSTVLATGLASLSVLLLVIAPKLVAVLYMDPARFSADERQAAFINMVADTVNIASPSAPSFVLNAVNLANAIRPKVQYAAIVGSYGWATRAVDIIAGAIPNLKVEVLGAVMAKGLPKEEDYQKLSELADAIAEKHK